MKTKSLILTVLIMGLLTFLGVWLYKYTNLFPFVKTFLALLGFWTLSGYMYYVVDSDWGGQMKGRKHEKNL